ncbi:MAG: alpha/beta hydrolase [Pseudoxanthomonas sp.]
MTPHDIAFVRNTLRLSAHLYRPEATAAATPFPAVVIATPGSSVKEQIGANYARGLVARGFAVLTLDPAYQGQSEGVPRDLESPAERVADLRSAVDFLSTCDDVDAGRIGLLGLCAGGGYAVSATMTDHRIKALGTVVPVNIGRAFRQMLDVPDTLQAVAAQANAEAHGQPAVRHAWIPDTLDEAHAAGIDDIDVLQAVTYYRTARGQHPASTNRRHALSDALILGFDAFHLADQLLTQPVQVIVAGASAGTTGSFEDGHQLARLAPAAEPVLAIAQARHYEMYDVPAYVDQAVQQLATFFHTHLPG